MSIVLKKSVFQRTNNHNLSCALSLSNEASCVNPNTKAHGFYPKGYFYLKS